MAHQGRQTLSEYIALMNSANSLTREIGFQQLRPYANEFTEELTATFLNTVDPDLRYRLFILLVESKSPKARNAIQHVFDIKDMRLIRTYDALTGSRTDWAYPARPGTLAGPILLQVKPIRWGALVVFFLPYIAGAMLGSLILCAFGPSQSPASWFGNIAGYAIGTSVAIWLWWPALREDHTISLSAHEIEGSQHGRLLRRKVVLNLDRLDRAKSTRLTLWQKLFHYRVICSTDGPHITLPLLLYERAQLSELLDQIDLQGLLDGKSGAE